MDYLEGGRFLMPNKASCVLVKDLTEPSILTLNFASVLPKNVYSTGVCGHVFNFRREHRQSWSMR